MSHEVNPEDAAKKRSLAVKLKQAEKVAREKAIKEREKFRGLQIRPTASFFDDADAKEPGEGNWSGFGFDIHPQVTIVSSLILAVFIVITLMFKEQAAALADTSLATISGTFGWFFILAANIFIGAALFFAFSRFGHIKIGGVDAQPEFATIAWYAMLLSAGMGIGLMFWSVGEPMYHYANPSPMFSGVEGLTPEAAQAAMGVTYFHWGLHPWAIYAIVGLGLAFFAYNRGLPLTIRSIFHPILGNKIHGFWGNLIDVLSVLATSLGLGVQQVNAGLNHLFGLNISPGMQVLLIAIITGIATISVMAGLDGGVKRLSEWNMGLAAIFMLFLLIAGPTIYILSGFTQNLGFYLTHLAELSLWTETFKESNWQGAWTVFYWAWWISWSPFVGMFIARISKGRTVREFILGVMDVGLWRIRPVSSVKRGCRHPRSCQRGRLHGAVRPAGEFSAFIGTFGHRRSSCYGVFCHFIGLRFAGGGSPDLRGQTRFPGSPACVLGDHGGRGCRRTAARWRVEDPPDGRHHHRTALHDCPPAHYLRPVCGALAGAVR